MIVFSDVHLQPDSAEVVLTEVLPGIVKVASEVGTHQIACLGDFYHLRYRLEVWLQNAVLDFLRGPGAGFQWHFLPGNHDQIDVAGRNALEAFGSLDNVTVYTEPTDTADFLWLPYRKDAREFLPHIANSKAPICMIHHGFAGALRNNGTTNDTGLHPSAVAKFALVLSGHYHKAQTVANVEYVGSPYETRADEAGDPHGYVLLQGRTLQRVSCNWGPRHHKVWVRDAEAVPNYDGYRPGDVVRAFVTRENAGAVAEKLDAAGVAYTLDFQLPDAPVDRLQVKENASLLEYAGAYVAAAETTLDKERLMGTLKDALGIA
jgi:hypothetical protein